MLCIACGGSTYAELAALPRCTTGDGRVFPRALRKISCIHCGLVSHADPPDHALLQEFYSHNYDDLGVAIGKAEQHRLSAYSRLIMTLVGDRAPERVLEVGCGSGQLLEQLAGQWPNTIFLGLEAAQTLAQRNIGERISIQRGFIEEAEPAPSGFDLVFAINVIEHAPEPQRFLAAIAAQLRPAGLCVITCPAADPPNLEMVIADHLHTFTATALDAISKKANIRLLGRFADETIGYFQALLLERPDGRALRGNVALQSAASESDAKTLARRRADYLLGWSRLNAGLCERTASIKHLVAFGAGEAAALMRAYAPDVWSRIEFLAVDNHYSSRRLDKPVKVYPEGIRDEDTAVLLAVHPSGQEGLAARLRNDRKTTITWHDLVPR